jgi:hopanoid biosynthesis associated RND transporter like protein HpnN
MPHEKPSPVERPLVWVTRLVLRYPIATLVIGLLLALAAAVVSQLKLGFRTNRLDLLNPKSEFNRRWIEDVREFGDQEDVVVVVEGPGRKEVVEVRDALAAEIARETRLFHSVLAGIDESKLRSKGLYYRSPEELAAIEGFLDRMEPVVRGQWAWLNLGFLGSSLCEQLGMAGGDPAAVAAVRGQLACFVQGLQAALNNRYQSPWPMPERPASSPEEADARQLVAAGGRMGFILLKLVKNDAKEDFVHGAQSIAALRDLIARAQARSPQSRIGLTGLPVIEHDEMKSSQTSMAQVSLVSLAGVSLLFVAGFGGWRHPLLAVVSLSVGTIWAMGYITVAVGHLNILSSAFAVILIGQGIDFSMYYVAQYLQLRSRIASTREALEQTVATVGPGVATGAITTAIAFFMAGLTEFTGVAELGIIAGGGILLCWIAGMTLLPAMIHLTDTRWPYGRVPLPVDVRTWLDPMFRRPWLVLGLSAALCVVLGFGLTRTAYDYNLLHLQARGLESVDLEQKLLRQSDHNASFALSIAGDPCELLARKERFLQLPCVKRVEEIASMFPGGTETKRPLVEALHRRLAGLVAALPQEGPPTIPTTPAADLVRILAQAETLVAGSPQAADFVPLAERTIQTLHRLAPADCQPRLAAYQQRMAAEIVARIRELYAVSNPEPPQAADLPESLVSRFVSPGGRHLMKVYCQGDVWDVDTMRQFVEAVRSVDPEATGNPMQIYEASQQMRRSYEEAALYALLIIVPVVFLDFRNVRHTLLALLPLGLGMLQMFGLMGLLRIPLNPANMIVLPLILGIGIDAGVHVVHDYCAQRGPYRINPSTASAVVINSLTNMAGFGSLMIASHRGLQSLGRVITLGLTCCLFTALVMLPAMLTLWSRRRFRQHQAPHETTIDDAVATQRPLRRAQAA